MDKESSVRSSWRPKRLSIRKTHCQMVSMNKTENGERGKEKEKAVDLHALQTSIAVSFGCCNNSLDQHELPFVNTMYILGRTVSPPLEGR